jgi:acyl carrier protein
VLRKQYQLTIAANDDRTREHFRSINTLAALVESQREAAHAASETTRKGD